MNKDMKKLLKHLSEGNYSASDVIAIIGKLNSYERAEIKFQKATTPESEALARWDMQDARDKWNQTTSLYDLPKLEISKLIIT